MNHIFYTPADVIAVYGEPMIARRKTLVTIREPKEKEVFERADGKLTAVEGVDWVVVPVDGSQPYPCKKNIFADTWETTEQKDCYRKKALSRLIPVPKGDVVVLNTLEGTIRVKFPDYIVLGAHDEVYSKSYEFVLKNLERLSGPYLPHIFTVKEDHLKLLSLNSFSINFLRYDYRELDNFYWELIHSNFNPDKELTEDLMEYYYTLHNDASTALEIVLKTQSFIPGRYAKTVYNISSTNPYPGSNWEIIEK